MIKNQPASIQKRMREVFEYIEMNLSETMSLQQVAKVAAFSPFHFHRIFKTITSETLNNYITRQRIELAAHLLIRSELPIGEIALKSGYADTATFSRTFKKFYNENPTNFRTSNADKHRKIHQLESKIDQPVPSYEKYVCNMENLKNWMQMNAEITVEQIASINVAYVNCLGPQNLQASYHTLMQWANHQQALTAETKAITIYHDSFKITAYDKVRMSACLSLNSEYKSTDTIGMKQISGGRHIIAKMEIKPQELENVWTALFIWMNEQGYKKSENNPFEIYHNDFSQHPEGKCEVELCIPIL